METSFWRRFVGATGSVPVDSDHDGFASDVETGSQSKSRSAVATGVARARDVTREGATVVNGRPDPRRVGRCLWLPNTNPRGVQATRLPITIAS